MLTKSSLNLNLSLNLCARRVGALAVSSMLLELCDYVCVSLRILFLPLAAGARVWAIELSSERFACAYARSILRDAHEFIYRSAYEA